jgi:hypothetical protein
MVFASEAEAGALSWATDIFFVWRLGGASRPKLVDKIVLDAGI